MQKKGYFSQLVQSPSSIQKTKSVTSDSNEACLTRAICIEEENMIYKDCLEGYRNLFEYRQELIDRSATWKGLLQLKNNDYKI